MPHPIANDTDARDRHPLFHNAVINVKAHFDAEGDGSTDDTTAIQNALDAAVEDGGEVYFPPGTYKVSSTLTLGESGATTQGVILRGAGKNATTIAPTTAVTGPVIKFINGRACHVEGMRIKGNGASGTAPSAAIEVHRDTPGASSPSRMVFKHLWLADTVADGLDNGIRFTAAQTGNNDFCFAEDVDVENVSGACYSFEHASSVGHTIVGGYLNASAKAVHVTGATFKMKGTRMTNMTGQLFDFAAPTTGTYTYQSSAEDVVHEYNLGSGTAATIVRTTTDALQFVLDRYTQYGSRPTTTVIDWQSPGALTVVGSNIDTGQVAQTADFGHTSSVARFYGCRLGLTTITYDGRLEILGNVFTPGTTTLTGGGSSKLVELGNSGGGLGTDLTVPGALNHDGSTIGFYGATPAAKPEITGSRADTDAALADLLASLETLGLITDSSTA